MIPEAHVAYMVAGLEPGSPDAVPRAFHLIGVGMDDPNVAAFKYARIHTRSVFVITCIHQISYPCHLEDRNESWAVRTRAENTMSVP